MMLSRHIKSDSPLAVALYFLGFLCFGGAATAALICLTASDLMGAFLGMLCFGLVVWFVVRWLNNRADPRHQLPPDP